MKSLIALGAALSTVALSTAAPQSGGPSIQITEIRIDQPSGDNQEYFELTSSGPKVSLDGLTYLVIGDGSSGSGSFDAIVDLTGSITNLEGRFLAAESTFSADMPPVFLVVPDLVTNLNFENGDNVTHLLVEGFTGMMTDDLDVDDDGVLDVTPWTRILDAVSLVESPDLSASGSEHFYGSSLGFSDVGPSGTFVPAHVFRCGSDWRIGNFAPVGDTDTPGAENDNCVGDTSAFCDPGAANEVSATGGKMGFTGSFSVQANDTTLTAMDIPDNFCLFVQSDTVAAPTMAPIGGNVCVTGANIIRLNVILLASNNQTSLALDIDPMSGTNEGMFGVMPGMTLYYQMFHRDSTFAGGGNWTNGLAATWTL